MLIRAMVDEIINASCKQYDVVVEFFASWDNSFYIICLDFTRIIIIIDLNLLFYKMFYSTNGLRAWSFKRR